MTTPRHFHPHLPHVPFRGYVIEHPYALDWLLLAAVTLVGLLLWF